MGNKLQREKVSNKVRTRNYVAASKMKDKRYLTKILDLYPDAIMKTDAIYSTDAIKIYKIRTHIGEFLLKTVDLSADDKETSEKLNKEFKKMQDLANENPFFSKHIGIASGKLEDGNVRIETLTEYGGLSLLKLMESASRSDIKTWIIQSLIAFKYLNKRGIIHIDIKPDSIFCEKGKIKILDLDSGLNKAEDPSRIMTEKYNTYYWGITFYQLITRKSCEKTACVRKKLCDTEEKVYNSYLEEIIHEKELVDMDEKRTIANLIGKCLSFKPENRPSFDELEDSLSEIESEIYGGDVNFARIYKQVGNSYRECLSDYKAAMSYYEKALKINLKVHGENNISTAHSYNNIGMIWDDNRNYKKALEFYEKSLSIKLKILGEDHTDTATSYLNIGSTYYNLSNYKKALEFYTKSIRISSKLLGKDHIDVADCHQGLGDVFRQLKDYKTALINYERALAIHLEILGENHLSTALSYYKVGHVCNFLGDYNKAFEHHHKSLGIRKNILGEDHINVARSFYGLGIAYENMKNYPAALANYEKALPIYKKVCSEESEHTKDIIKKIENIKK